MAKEKHKSKQKKRLNLTSFFTTNKKEHPISN